MIGYWPLQIEKMVTSTTVTYSKFMIPRGTIVELSATVLTNIQICKDYVWGGDFGDSWRDPFLGDSQESGAALTRVTDIWSSDAEGATLDNDYWTANKTTAEPTLDKTDKNDGLRALSILQDDSLDTFGTSLNGDYTRQGRFYQRPIPGGINLAVPYNFINTDNTKPMTWWSRLQLGATQRLLNTGTTVLAHGLRYSLMLSLL